MSLLSLFLSFLFPNHCRLCGKGTDAVCATCKKSIVYMPYLPDRQTIAFYAYRKSGLKDLLWLLKYHHQRPIAHELGGLLADALLPELEERVRFEHFVDPVIIPVPVSKRGLRKRGYNQVTLIAQGFLDHAQVNFPLYTDVLLKSRETKKQARNKKRKERFTNIEGSFTLVHPERISGRNIILLDDVTTTGATLDEATSVLMRAKPRKILRVALAH